MRLFKSKTPIDDAVRCPECGERVPEGADECAMCGRDLHDLPSSSERSSSVF
jgi:DNA-directed RNA polymerase subunit RPC12/RpoP